MTVVKFPKNDRLTVHNAVETTVSVIDSLLVMVLQGGKSAYEIELEERGLNTIRRRVNIIVNLIEERKIKATHDHLANYPH